MQNPIDTLPVGEVIVGDESFEFNNSVYERCSDFNNFELEFAKDLIRHDLVWMRKY